MIPSTNQNQDSQPTEGSGNFELTSSSLDVVDRSTLDQVVKEIKQEFQEDTDEAKKQYIAIFGIFASIITLLGIEVQAFNKFTSISKLVGFSAFLLSAILILLFAIDYISSINKRHIGKNALLWIALIMFIFSTICFWYSIMDHNLVHRIYLALINK